MDKSLVSLIQQPLKLLNKEDQYSFVAKVNGGGFSAQAQAIRLAISRFLLNENNEYRTVLRSEGLLTRDPRSKERRKPGFLKARKKPPFVKR